MGNDVSPVTTAGRPALRSNNNLRNPSQFGSIYGSNQGVDQGFQLTPGKLIGAVGTGGVDPGPQGPPPSAPQGGGGGVWSGPSSAPPAVTAPMYTPDWRHQIGALEEWRKGEMMRGASAKEVLAVTGETGAHEGGGHSFLAQYGPGGTRAEFGSAYNPAYVYDWASGKKLNVATGNPGNESGPQAGTIMGKNGKLHFNQNDPAAWQYAEDITPEEMQSRNQQSAWSAANPGKGYDSYMNEQGMKRDISAGHFTLEPKSGMYYNRRPDGSIEWKDKWGRRYASAKAYQPGQYAGQNTSGSLPYTGATPTSGTSAPPISGGPVQGGPAQSPVPYEMSGDQVTSASMNRSSAPIHASYQGSEGGEGGPPPASPQPNESGTSPAGGTQPSGAGQPPQGPTPVPPLTSGQTSNNSGGLNLSGIPLNSGAPNYQAYSAQGPSQQEQAMLNSITELARMLQGQGTGLFNIGMPAYAKAIEYYQKLLGGSRAAMGAAVAPASESLREQYKGAESAINSGYLRGGAKDQALGELQRSQSSELAHLTQGVQPQAAASLMSGGLAGANAAGQFESAAGGFYGAALTNLTQGRQFEESLSESSKQFGASLSEQVRANNMSYNQAMAGLSLQKLLSENNLAEQARQFGLTFGAQQSQWNQQFGLQQQQWSWQQAEQQRQHNYQSGQLIAQLGGTLLTAAIIA